jgi:hypothetical protein
VVSRPTITIHQQRRHPIGDQRAEKRRNGHYPGGNKSFEVATDEFTCRRVRREALLITGLRDPGDDDMETGRPAPESDGP